MTSSGGYRPSECFAWVTMQRKHGDPLLPEWVTTRIEAETQSDIWRQIAEFEDKGWAVCSIEGESR